MRHTLPGKSEMHCPIALLINGLAELPACLKITPKASGHAVRQKQCLNGIQMASEVAGNAAPIALRLTQWAAQRWP